MFSMQKRARASSKPIGSNGPPYQLTMSRCCSCAGSRTASRKSMKPGGPPTSSGGQRLAPPTNAGYSLSGSPSEPPRRSHRGASCRHSRRCRRTAPRHVRSRHPSAGLSPCRSEARHRTPETTDRRSNGHRYRIPRGARRSTPWSSGSRRAEPPVSSTRACRCAARSSAPAPAARCAAARPARSPPRSVGLPLTRHGLGPASAIVNQRSAGPT